MRPVLPTLLALLVLLPAGAARPLLEGDERAGPCRVAWDHQSSGTYWQEPTYETAGCHVDGHEVVYAGEGTDWSSHWCAARALGLTLLECPV